ncbi:DUF1003 domain-containing protein [Nakamurella flava]|uniref:DUF1003 domain-containing protein n=1 Tax=Nakamurella flava TaxID=2576308 RepID=A0A4U6QMI9_9ACTN|nr:DUF1003 domain-containing protein [Nakamurella flava]TKV61306.1 DUF1003 domain-containing protein [Nakamurella flava]
MTSSTLSNPRANRFKRPQLLNPDAFGRASEQFARYMGTSKFLVQMSLFIAVWLGWNSLAPANLQFDPYTFTFLTLLLSLQASYAAPLILLAQNRQDDRDRAEAARDRQQTVLNYEINSYLTRELSDLRGRLGEISSDLDTVSRRLTPLPTKKKDLVATSSETRDLAARLDRIERMLEKMTKQRA